MKMGSIEFDPEFARAGAALSVTILLAVAISMSMAGCSLFNSSAGAGKSGAASRWRKPPIPT